MKGALTAVAVIVAVGTAAGLAILWPGDTETRLQGGLAVDATKAEVAEVTESTCPGLGNQRCQLVTARLTSGRDAGKRVELQLSAIQGFDPDLDPGDDIRVTKAPEPPPGQEAVAGPGYSFYDFQRGTPILVLALAFVAIVLLFARFRGALSLVGLGFSLALVLLFVVPAILDGKPPLAVAIVGSLAVALITIPMAHGGGPKTLAAVLGTAASLLFTALLALVFTKAAHLTGFSSEEATFLQLAGANLSLEGLLLAGMVIAALGVLDDVTVSQASTVLALRSANPTLRFRQLFAVAQRVGRDHVSATVNTLVLAYVGASLPVLLIFSSSDLGIGEALSTEVVAKEVVATLVGSIGLIAAVPLTTALAAVLALGEEPEALAGVDHGHAH
ncbi:MAG: YibE/F family protein [Thermoleophilaceae bacterium]|nr:YibE/F family protein [Thermoleophilaceae bacterium]